LTSITGDAGNLTEFMIKVNEEKERVRGKLEVLDKRQKKMIDNLAEVTERHDKDLESLRKKTVQTATKASDL